MAKPTTLSTRYRISLCHCLLTTNTLKYYNFSQQPLRLLCQSAVNNLIQ